MAKEYIDREATIAGIENVLREKADKKDSLAYFAFRLFAETLKRAPAADVVEVVRCKECIQRRYHCFGQYYCQLFLCKCKDNDYCSRGKRKEGADNGMGVET